MLPQGGIIVLWDNHPVYLSFLLIVQNDAHFLLIDKLFTIYASIYLIFTFGNLLLIISK